MSNTIDNLDETQESIALDSQGALKAPVLWRGREIKIKPEEVAPQHQPFVEGQGQSPDLSQAAILLGIQYLASPSYLLKSSFNDLLKMKNILQKHFNFSSSRISVLSDQSSSEHSSILPTRNNILSELELVASKVEEMGIKHLFFYYNGHAGYEYNPAYRSLSKEMIIPSDFQSKGPIYGEDLQRIFSKVLAKGCQVTVVLDCSYSASLLPLPYRFDAKKVASEEFQDEFSLDDTKTNDSGTLFCLSSCGTEQVAGDIYEEGIGWSGALTWAFAKVVEQSSENLNFTSLSAKIQTLYEDLKLQQQLHLSFSKAIDLQTWFFSILNGKKKLWQG